MSLTPESRPGNPPPGAHFCRAVVYSIRYAVYGIRSVPQARSHATRHLFDLSRNYAPFAFFGIRYTIILTGSIGVRGMHRFGARVAGVRSARSCSPTECSDLSDIAAGSHGDTYKRQHAEWAPCYSSPTSTDGAH